MILECLMPQAAVYARKYGERQSPASGSTSLTDVFLFCAHYHGREPLRGPLNARGVLEGIWFNRLKVFYIYCLLDCDIRILHKVCLQ